MARKRQNPFRGPMLTLALMLASVGVVVAVGNRIDGRQNTQERTVDAAASSASPGQETGRQAAGAKLGG